MVNATFSRHRPNFSKSLTWQSAQQKDTTPLRNKIVKDSIVVPKIDTLQFKTAKDGIDDIVEYHADDSAVFDVPTKKFILYGKTNSVKYADNELTAPFIEYDQNTSQMSAYLKMDSSGKVVARPVFEQSDLSSVADTIRFDMKTGKGLTKGTYTKQGEIFIQSERLKKVNSNTLYALNTKFTTCNLDTPHFAFVSRKVKIINQKTAFTGPVHPEFEGVPLPITFPFGIYPLKQGRHSGLIAPTFTANAELGLALEGIGYYKIISDNWDITTRGTIYSYGGWTFNLSPRYMKRYRYQGGLSLEFQNLKNLDNTGGKTFNIRWSHNTDSKARPGVTFTGSVNAGSSKFNQNVPNSPQRRFNNQLNSTISYAKVWKDLPFNLTLAANHSQNTNQKFVQITLPDLAFNMNTIYPLKRKNKIGDDKWYENLGIGLNTSAKSNSNFYDTSGNIGKQFGDNFQWGARHSVPLTLSLPSFGPLQVAPQISYSETWYQKKILRAWNTTTSKVDTTIKTGFYTAREVSYALGVSTRIFGMYGFKKSSRVQAIRHEIRPTISLNYKPDNNANAYQDVQVDTSGQKSTVSIYDGSLYGAYSRGKFGGMSFGLDNVVQMKVRDKTDTAQGATKKINLIDGFNIRSGYNFLEDSFQLQPINIDFRTNLFEKINISASAGLMPYSTNNVGRFVNRLVWRDKLLSLGTLTFANISMQTSFRGGAGKGGAANNTPQQNPVNNPYSSMPLDEYQREAAYINANPAEFADFSIPWDINFSYSFSYNRLQNPDLKGYSGTITQNVTGGGSLNLTPKWKFSLNGSYDITRKDLGVITASLSREMHCWQMNINISKSPGNSFFNITISPKSSILRDLKINRTRYSFDSF